MANNTTGGCVFYFIYFFHENYFYFFLFRDVPGFSGLFRHVPVCSGMFRVPGFIDAHKNAPSLEKGEIRIKTQGREWGELARRC